MKKKEHFKPAPAKKVPTRAEYPEKQRELREAKRQTEYETEYEAKNRHRKKGIHLRMITVSTAPKGLDKSCYGKHTKSYHYELWRDGGRVGVFDSQSSAEAAAALLAAGAKLLPSNRCVADGVSLKTLDKKYGPRTEACIFPK